VFPDLVSGEGSVLVLKLGDKCGEVVEQTSDEREIERSEAPVVVSVKITVFWDVTPCSLVRLLLTFRRTCCFCL
jgi:hypothetical protein